MFAYLGVKGLLARPNQQVHLYSVNLKVQALGLHLSARLVNPQLLKCVLRMNSYAVCIMSDAYDGVTFSLPHIKLVARLGLVRAMFLEGLARSSNLSSSRMLQLLKLVSDLSGQALNNRSNSQINQLNLVEEGYLASRFNHKHHSKAQQRLGLVVHLERVFWQLKQVLGSPEAATYRLPQACLVLRHQLLNLLRPRLPLRLARSVRH